MYYLLEVFNRKGFFFELRLVLCLLEELGLASGEPVKNAAGIDHLDTMKFLLRLSRQLIYMVEIRPNNLYTIRMERAHCEVRRRELT